jgi:hypothetical protein
MSRTITRKELITEQYAILKTQIEQTGLIKGDIFPSLNDIDIGDLIYFFQLTFSDSSNYKESIIDLLECKNIYLDIKEQDKIVNIIIPFLEIFNKYI